MADSLPKLHDHSVAGTVPLTLAQSPLRTVSCAQSLRVGFSEAAAFLQSLLLLSRQSQKCLAYICSSSVCDTATYKIANEQNPAEGSVYDNGMLVLRDV